MNSKLLPYLVSFSLGIILATYVPLSWGFLFFAIGVVLATITANKYWFWNKSNYWVLLLIFLLGASRQHFALSQLNKAEAELLEREIIFLGVVVEEPVKREGSIDYIVKGSGRKVLVKISREALSSVNETEQVPGFGDILQVNGYIRPPMLPANPGQFNYFAYCRKLGIVGTIQPHELVIKKDSREPGVIIQKLALKLRDNFRDVLVQSLSAEDFQIVDGLIFGGTAGLDEDFKSDLQKAGLIHILSVSGFHVSLLLAGVLMVLKWSRIEGNKRVSLLIIIVVLGLYILMTGLRPSVIRAAVMALIPVVGLVAGRKNHWVTSISIAALSLLLWNPANLFMAGTQLSFAATWGILYLAKPIARSLSINPPQLRDSMSIIVAAQLGTLPLMAYHFNFISVIGFFLNLLAIPLITVIVALACISLAAGLIYLPLALLINTATSIFLHIIKLLSWLTGQLPLAVFNVRSPAFWEAAIFYGVAILLGKLYWQRSYFLGTLWLLKRQRLLMSGLVVTLGALILLNSILQAHTKIQVTFLAVGEGDCAVLTTSRGGTILVDAGPGKLRGSPIDTTRAIVVPYLRSQGVQKIDLLIISHFHQDHVGGILNLLREVPIKKALLPAGYQQTEEADRVVEALQEEGVELVKAKAGQRWVLGEDLVISVLGPPRDVVSAGFDENDNSTLFSLSFGKINYLFTGDIGNTALDYYLNPRIASDMYSEALAANVIKIPHHGSINSLNERLYEAVNPQAAVISVGPNNYGHPSENVIGTLKAKGAKVFRTDWHGAIMTSTDGQELRIATFEKEGY